MAVVIFGGFSPAILTWLGSFAGLLAPAFYVMTAAAFPFWRFCVFLQARWQRFVLRRLLAWHRCAKAPARFDRIFRIPPSVWTGGK
ncbi:hypothetical protein M3I54_38390 [Paraburkholderia sp. CNPSo 3274]|uniref:hypothetical protein n=1 Tax=Paraburkholderia sp. CNPSo 3274 TaxID=2940932 RepID=UPI0020B75725|nr:hypothetical protein [Paraburkholderia sp. CNPSo 3274]MCP3712710.1 hypothetical protein [Paraburkholderia sp. CNPSo 3274]